jgi:competence protein ComEA
MNSFLKTLVLGALALVSATVFAAVDVNKASQAELESIKGIGPAVSTRIVDARKTAAFKDWGDLAQRVKGVGDRSAAKFSAQGLTVNGAAFDAATAMPVKTSKKDDAKANSKASSKAGPKKT